MARKSVPRKKQSTEDNEPSITVIRKGTCKNLIGTADLTYHLGLDETSALHWQIHSNSGNGMFSKAWVAFDDIQATLIEWSKKHTITSLALYPLYKGKSVNTPSFLLAALLNEGLIEPHPEKRRHYQLTDPKKFLAEVEKLKASHSAPGKAKPKAKAKAASRMQKGKAKAETATGK